VELGTLLGMNLEFIDSGAGGSYFWVVAANSPYQKMRVDAISFTALGWLHLQTGAPVIQPVYPRDNDEVSGHFPFMIYATSAAGDMGIVSAEFSADLGATWQPLERTDESGVWTRVWDTTVLTDGPREIRIRATDVSDLVATAVLQVTVDNSGGTSLELPTVVVDAPEAGAYVSGVTPIVFTATPGPGRTLLDTQIDIDGDPGSRHRARSLGTRGSGATAATSSGYAPSRATACMATRSRASSSSTTRHPSWRLSRSSTRRASLRQRRGIRSSSRRWCATRAPDSMPPRCS